MTTAITTPTVSLAKSAKAIATYDLAVKKSFQEQMVYAWLAGHALNQVKSTLPHGDFIPWIENNLPQLQERSCQRYMAFNERLALKNDTVSDLAAAALLENGEIPEPVKVKVAEAVYKEADGRSLTDMYRDLGIIKTPPPAGGFRPPEKAVQAWLKENHPELAGTKFADLSPAIQKAFKKQFKPELDPAITAEARRDAVRMAFKEVARVMDEGYFKDCTDEERADCHHIAADAAKTLSSTLRTKKK